MALSFDPIAPFSAMMMTLKTSHFGSPELEQRICALDSASRATKASDPTGWLGLYQQTLALLPPILSAQKALEASKALVAKQGQRGQRLQAAGVLTQSAIQNEKNTWADRIEKQTQDLIEKAERSIEKLEVSGVHDETRGETVFTVDRAMLEAFWGWLDQALATWDRNNELLVVQRLQEALALALKDLPNESSYQASAPQLATSPPARPKPPSFTGLTPGFFDSMGAAYKVVTLFLGGVSTLCIIFGQRVELSKAVNQALPYAFGAALLIVVLAAAIQVPKQQRQSLNRVRLRATEQVKEQLASDIQAYLRLYGKTQLSSIQRHLAAESTRSASLAKALLPSSSVPGELSPSGLLPRDAAKLEGEWQEAIRARIGELQASELGALGAPKADAAHPRS